MEEEFNPLELFPEYNKKVPKLSWSLPDTELLRSKFYEFLAYNQS